MEVFWRALYTFECSDITIITISRIVVHVIKNMLRAHEDFIACDEYINAIPLIEAM